MKTIILKKYTPYILEMTLLIGLLMAGIKFLDNYHDYDRDKNEYKLKSALHEKAVELSVETLSAMSSSIDHYDKHAQKQLGFESIYKDIVTYGFSNEILSNDVNFFIESIISYMQYATMLKTSFRFVSSMALKYKNLSPDKQAKVAEVISLISAFRNNSAPAVFYEIETSIRELDADFIVEDDLDFKWNMFKLHVDFILKEHVKSNSFLSPIQETEINKKISKHLKMLSKRIESRYLSMSVSFLMGTIFLFALLFLIMARQSMNLREANIKAKQAAESKAQFLANMSHEIRTPMNGILGLSEILLKTKLSSQQENYLRKLKFSAKSLTTIINDILDFSKIESKNLTIESIPFELNQLLDNMKTMIGRSASEKGLELIIKVDDNLKNGYLGDPVRIGQILLNLGSNAIKFTDSGHVILSVKLASHENGADHVVFSMCDTGIGINADQEKKLFKRFSQAESSTTRKYGGTGLGLTICKMLSELMDGEISLQSEEGKGSCFNVSLPLLIDEHLLAVDVNEESEKFKGLSVLVVEDNTLTSEVVTEVLTSLGCIVSAAFTGKQTDKILSGRCFDLILLDWVLPDIVGMDLITEVERHQGQYKNIIVFTGYDADYLSTGLKYPVINKPLIKSDLVNLLADVYIDPNNKEPDSVEKIKLTKKVHDNAGNLNSDFSNIKVLLAEDNEINMMVALDVLRGIGVNVECATTGSEAVAMVKKFSYDLVLMDIQMPEMDGIEATKAIRKFMTSAQLPIVALTANVLKEEVDHYIEVGMNAHLGKPFERVDLERVIETLSLSIKKGA